jgi:hypothetical protein
VNCYILSAQPRLKVPDWCNLFTSIPQDTIREFGSKPRYLACTDPYRGNKSGFAQIVVVRGELRPHTNGCETKQSNTSCFGVVKLFWTAPCVKQRFFSPDSVLLGDSLSPPLYHLDDRCFVFLSKRSAFRLWKLTMLFQHFSKHCCLFLE